MNIQTRTRQVSRLLIKVPVVLAGLGGAILLARRPEFPWQLGVVLLGAAGAGLSAAVAGMIWPRCHIVLHRLSAFGSPQRVAAAIDAELAQTDRTMTFGQPVWAFRRVRTDKFPVILTPSWLVQFGELSVRVVPLDDIVWVYKKVLTVGYGPGMREQWVSLVVHQNNGRSAEFRQSDAEVDRLVQALMPLLPGVRFGAFG